MGKNKKKLKIRLVANDKASREKGLMNSEPLEDNEVAIFIFPSLDYYSFWNKNVSYSISLAFLDENGLIVDFGKLKKEQEKSVLSNKLCKFVVEASENFFKNNDAEIGDKIGFIGGELFYFPK